MSRYANIRGFLDCDWEDFAVIRKIVAEVAAQHRDRVFSEEVLADYCSGWVFQPKVVNWVAHAFYGGSVKLVNEDLLLDQLRGIAAALPEIEGVFYVDDDEGEKRLLWTVHNGTVVESWRL
ncbi:hypothetical protein [Saccharothrix sp. HUAS TT1]|uniref:hypothetical protein n=1 Tax=unclassified Saccharothrix TaxID=2593673 RepID=UPI00345C132A